MNLPSFLLKTSQGTDRHWIDNQPISERSLTLIHNLEFELNNVLIHHKKTHIQKPDNSEEMSKEEVNAQIERIQLSATDGVQDLFRNVEFARRKYVLHLLHLADTVGLPSLEHFRDNHMEDYFSHLIDRKRATFEVFTSYDKLCLKHGEGSEMFNFWWDVHKLYGTNVEDTKRARTNRKLTNLMYAGKLKAERELLEVKIITKAVIGCPHTSQALELNKIPQDTRTDSQSVAVLRCQQAVDIYVQSQVDEWNEQQRQEKDKKTIEKANINKSNKEWFNNVLVPELRKTQKQKKKKIVIACLAKAAMKQTEWDKKCEKSNVLHDATNRAEFDQDHHKRNAHLVSDATAPVVRAMTPLGDATPPVVGAITPPIIRDVTPIVVIAIPVLDAVNCVVTTSGGSGQL